MDELDMQLRGMIVQGDVLAVDDTGEAQTITVQTHEGVVRTDVQVASFHGLASNPSDGAICLLFAVGGDQGHLISLPLSLPSARFGGLPKGGVALYDDAGNRLVFPADGTGLLTTADLFRLLVQTLRIEAQGGMEVHGPTVFKDDVEIQANLTVTGNMTINGNLQVNGSIHAGGGITHG